MTTNKSILILISGGLLALAAALTLSSTDPSGPFGAAAPLTDDAGQAAPAPSSSLERDALAAPAAVALAPYGAPVGSHFQFAFESARTVRMTSKGNAGPLVRFAGAGSLGMTVIARRDDEVLVELRGADLALEGDAEGDGEEMGGLEAELAAAPVLLRMRDDGRHLALRFEDAHGLEARQWLRNLISGLQFLVADGAAWEAEQHDLGGAMRVRFCWRRQPDGGMAGLLQKDLIAAVQLSGTDEMNVVPEVEGSYTAVLGGALGWFGGGEGSERWAVSLPDAEITVRTTRSARFELRHHDVTSIDRTPDWDGAWHPLDGAIDGAILARQNRLEQQRRQLQGVTVRQTALAVLAAAEAGKAGRDDLFDASQQLITLLELRPEELATIGELLLQVTPESRGASELIAAVGAVKNAAAEGFLCDLLADHGRPEALRLHTAISLFQVSEASAATIETGSRLVTETAGDGQLRRTGMLLVGRFADGSSQASANLLAMEAMATRDGMLTTWLEAVGNSRSPEAVAVAQRYVVHADAAVRAAAVHAIEEVFTAAATGLLLQRLPIENDHTVRRDIVFALSRRAQPAAIAAIDALLLNEPAQSLRLLALQGLSEVPGAVVTQLFARSAAQDPVTEVRDFAASVLAQR